MKAQSSHPEREVRPGVRSVPGFSECCPTTLHLHTDCRVCQLYFYGPPKPLTKDSSSGSRSASSKTHPLYSRKISAPEERHRYKRLPRQRILSTSQLPELPILSSSRQPPISSGSHQLAEPSTSYSSHTPEPYLPNSQILPLSPVSTSQLPSSYMPDHQFLPAPSNPLKNLRKCSQRPIDSALQDFQDDPSLRPLSADALDEGRRQEEAATRKEERFMAEKRTERKEVGVRRSVSFAGQRRTYQY